MRCREFFLADSLLAVVLSCLVSGAAWAAWPHDPDVNVPLCTAIDSQNDITACPDGAGGAIVVWSDMRSGNSDIYAQRISAAGEVLWTTDGVVVCSAASDQDHPVICADGAGGVLVVWEDQRNGNRDLYAGRLDAAGHRMWATDGVSVSVSANSQGRAGICSDGSGGLIVTWDDYRNGVDYNVYARRVSAAGTAQWTTNGTALCTATGHQYTPQIVADGAGGALVVWVDERGADEDLYARFVSSAGTPQGTANGFAVCTATGHQNSAAMVPDGAGGGIVAWQDMRGATVDLYTQRILSGGGVGWVGNGNVLAAGTGDETNVALASDGAGGAIAAWLDSRGADRNVYAQRVLSDGAVPWTANGVAVCTSTGDQANLSVVSDGSEGAIIGWGDPRLGLAHPAVYARRVSATGALQWTSGGVALANGCNSPSLVADEAGGAIAAFWSSRVTNSVWAQNVDRFGALGDAAPAIAGVGDVSADQGGQVLVRWTPSYRDADPTFAIVAYSVWREVPASLAAARAAALSRIGAGRPLRTTVEGTATTYWEYVGSTPARARDAYSMVVPTTTDSMAGSNPLTRFMVSAEESGGSPYWDSAPVMGYSVDNIAPPAPAPFTGAYANGAAILAWGASPASDFAAFRLYRGASADFVPGPGNLVATTTAGGFSDATPALHYKLCAVDEHGNASPYVALFLAGAVDVPGAALPRELFLAAPAPNPARAGALLRFGLPRAGRVALAVHDAQGRRVRMLEAGTLPAGEHAQRWDGADDAGRALPAGLYLVRLEVGGRVLTRRLAVLR